MLVEGTPKNKEEGPVVKVQVGPRGVFGGPASQGDPSTVVSEFTRKHASVQLVKLHQLDQV